MDIVHDTQCQTNHGDSQFCSKTVLVISSLLSSYDRQRHLVLGFVRCYTLVPISINLEVGVIRNDNNDVIEEFFEILRNAFDPHPPHYIVNISKTFRTKMSAYNNKNCNEIF